MKSDPPPLAVVSLSNGSAIVLQADDRKQHVVRLRPSPQKVLWCAVFLPSNAQTGTEATTTSTQQSRECAVFLSGSDRVLRKISLRGASCLIGSRHPISSLSAEQLVRWLHSKNLGRLVPLLQGKLGSDLLDEHAEMLFLSLAQQIDGKPGRSLLRRKSSLAQVLERRGSDTRRRSSLGQSYGCSQPAVFTLKGTLLAQAL